MPARVGLLLLACAASALAGCGGGGAKAGGEPIRIGVITACESPFNQENEPWLSGAELPLIERGAALRRTKPSGGLSGATVAGRPVQLITACDRYGDRRTEIHALSTLVERDRADVVIGSTMQGDGIALRDYARSHPGTTFLDTAFEQSTTLKEPAPNLFRFEPDAAQWYAGMGAYARHILGWKTAAIVGEPDAAGWTPVAGFEAEFCSLGGHAIRVWPQGQDQGDAVPQIPAGTDGVLLTGVSATGKLGGTGKFVPRWAKLHSPVSRHLLVGWSVLATPTRKLVGVVGSSSDPFQPTPAAWNRYAANYKRAFHNLDPGLANQPYFDEMEPLLEALEQVHGDVSGNEHRLMTALAALRYHSPEGLIRLDARHQAIAPIYLGRVELDASKNLTVRQIGVVRGAEQTFGGNFGPDTPAPSASQPGCVSGHPPTSTFTPDPGSTR